MCNTSIVGWDAKFKKKLLKKKAFKKVLLKKKLLAKKALLKSPKIKKFGKKAAKLGLKVAVPTALAAGPAGLAGFALGRIV